MNNFNLNVHYTACYVVDIVHIVVNNINTLSTTTFIYDNLDTHHEYVHIPVLKFIDMHYL